MGNVVAQKKKRPCAASFTYYPMVATGQAAGKACLNRYQEDILNPQALATNYQLSTMNHEPLTALYIFFLTSFLTSA